MPYEIIASFDSTFCFLLVLRADFSGLSLKPSRMSSSWMTSSSLSSGSRTRVKLSNDTWASASGLGVTSDCCRLTCSDNDNDKVTCSQASLNESDNPVHYHFDIHLSTIYLQRTPDSPGGWGRGLGRRVSPDESNNDSDDDSADLSHLDGGHFHVGGHGLTSLLGHVACQV